MTGERPKAVVLDLGKQSRKKVRELRKGEGALLADVHDAVEHLREGGVVGADAQTVIVVVERRAPAMAFPFAPLVR
jgi:uncharacterized protein DUF6200